MKVFFLLFFILANTNYIFSQKQIGLTFNSCNSGRSINLNCTKMVNASSKFGFSILYNINSFAHIDDKELYHHKRLYALDFKQRFGLQFNYSRYIKIEKIQIPIYLFTDVQLKYSSTQNNEHHKVYFDTSYQMQFYQKYILNYGPYLWIQNSYGIGFDIHIFKNISISQKIGLGYEFIYGPDNKNGTNKNRSWIQPALLFNTSLFYTLP